MSEMQRTPGVRFVHLAPEIWSALATLSRTVWVRRGIDNPESVRERTIALREIAYSIDTLPDKDKDDLADVLEVHAWPMAIHGDEVIVTNDEAEKKLLKAIKFQKEHRAIIDICAPLEDGDHILGLWLRFETSDDEIAVLARQLDKYQEIGKAFEYEREQGVLLFEEFLEYARKDIDHPLVLEKIEILEFEWDRLQQEKSPNRQ